MKIRDLIEDISRLKVMTYKKLHFSNKDLNEEDKFFLSEQLEIISKLEESVKTIQDDICNLI